MIGSCIARTRTVTAALKTKLTASEYLAIEGQAEFKSEFFNGETFAMAGACPRHNFIRENLIVEIGSRLKGSPCREPQADCQVARGEIDPVVSELTETPQRAC